MTGRLGLARLGLARLGLNQPTADTTPPTVNRTSGATQRLSSVPSFDAYSYSFTASEALQAWEVRLGTTVIESGGALAAGANAAGALTYTELKAAGAIDGADNTVTFVGRDLAGNWSA